MPSDRAHKPELDGGQRDVASCWAWDIVTATPAIAPVARGARRPPRWELAVVGTWFVVLAALADYFPRSGDDWVWGSAAGNRRLDTLFAGINGRYGGNLLIVALLRTGPLAAVVLSAVVCASAVLLLQLTGNRTPLGYGLVSALVLAMPLGVWRQGVVWLSGFVNYGVATLFLLGFLVIAASEWSRFGQPGQPGQPAAPTRLQVVAVAVAGFTGQLFMEHVTLCICALGIVLTFAGRRVHRSWPTMTTTWTLAALVGAAVMFSNSAYRHAVAGNAKYQGVQPASGKNAARKLAVKVVDYLPTQAVVQNLALNAVLLVLLVLIALRAKRVAGAWSRWAIVVVVASVAWAALGYWLWLVERHGVTAERVRALATLDVVLLAVALVVTGAKLLSDRRRQWTLWLLCGAVVLLVLPLAFVHPLGPRCFYPSYFLLLAIVSVLATPATDAFAVLRLKGVAIAPHAIAVALLVAMFIVYVRVDRAAERRIADVRAAVAAGHSSVEVKPLPFPSFVHDGDPFDSRLQRSFKAYNHLPRDLRIELVPNPWVRSPGKPARARS